MKAKVEQLTAEFESFLEDVKKLEEKGVKAAAPRARKALQNITVLAKSLRSDIQEKKNSL